MNTVLYRKSLIEPEELEIIKKYFPVTDCIVGIKEKLVIGRFACVPFYDEFEKNLLVQNSKPINSWREHRYIANFEYYYDIEEFTPKTWFRLQDVDKNEAPFVLKGTTTSKKSSWNTLMFAPSMSDATRIYCELKNDYMLGAQDIIIRKYESLKKLGEGINGMPFVNEWRFFFYKEELLSHGFYWSIADVVGEMNSAGLLFAKKIARIIAQKTNYFVLDIAQKEDGNWTLVEVNDGQSSGISENNPDILYCNLKKVLNFK